MKKRITAVVTAALSMLTMTTPMFSHAEKNEADFVIFGDNIAAGDIRGGTVEHNFGEILADYYGGTVTNYAESSLKSNELLDKITGLNDEQKNAVKGAEYVVINVGANDIARYSAVDLLQFCASKKLLNEGYTAADIPDDPTLDDLFTLVDEDALQTFASASVTNSFALLTRLRRISSNLCVSNDTYEGYLKNVVVDNINKSVAEIKKINPDAEIIVQNIYQPLQLPSDYIEYHTSGNSNYITLLNQIRSILEDIMKAFDEEVNASSGEYGYKVADVFTEFTSLDPSVIKNGDNPGNASYFVDIMGERLSDGDIQPNQKGHLAIAAEIIDTIGIKHTDLGLFSEIYENLEDKAAYPVIALKTYESAAGSEMLGDVNFDGIIDAVDASAILTEYAVTSVNSDAATFHARQTKCAMVSDDDVLDAIDASLVLTYYAYTSTNGNVSLEEFIKSQN